MIDFDEIPELSIEDAANFAMHEVECNCGCGQKIVQPKLVYILQAARTRAGIPFHITSWNRCTKYNAKIKGAVLSAHIKGFAVDIKAEDSLTRFKVIRSLLIVGAPRLKVYGGHIHVDIDPDKFWGVFMLS